MRISKQAISIAKAGQVQRLLAEAESDLADAYRARGDLPQALRYATAAVADTTAAGSRFTLPGRMRVLAEIYAAQDRVADANRVYDQAADIVEGIMVNVPSREAQARLVGVTSELYAGHFRLAADRLNDPVKAYDIIERARGRTAADVLRALPDDNPVESQAAAAQAGVISRLQVRLMRAQSPSERRQLLDQLWEAEQRSKLRGAEPGASLVVGGNRATARTLQRTLARNELVLEYVLSDPESYCLVISRSGIRLAKLASRARIETLVDRFTQDLRSGKGNATGAAKELHEAVLMPIKEWRTAQRLLVVPDGRLHLLPFDALLTQNAIVGAAHRLDGALCQRVRSASKSTAGCEAGAGAAGNRRRAVRSNVRCRKARGRHNTVGRNTRAPGRLVSNETATAPNCAG